jgi:hypothetical protein
MREHIKTLEKIAKEHRKAFEQQLTVETTGKDEKDAEKAKAQRNRLAFDAKFNERTRIYCEILRTIVKIKEDAPNAIMG